MQPGFILTDAHEVRHFFGVSSREEQKKWVACLRGLTSLNDSLTSIGETLEDGQVMAMQRRSRMCSVAPVPARPAVPGAGNAERSWWQRRASAFSRCYAGILKPHVLFLADQRSSAIDCKKYFHPQRTRSRTCARKLRENVGAGTRIYAFPRAQGEPCSIFVCPRALLERLLGWPPTES